MSARRDDKGFIYVAESHVGTERFLKIGFSRDPEARINSLVPTGATKIIPGGTAPALISTYTGTFATEQRIHRELKDVSVGGEWYPANHAFVQFVIAELEKRNGSDVSLNPPEPLPTVVIDETVEGYFDPLPTPTEARSMASELGKLRAKHGDMAAIGALGGIAARGRSGRPGVPTACPVCHAEQPSKRAAMAHCAREAK